MSNIGRLVNLILIRGFIGSGGVTILALMSEGGRGWDKDLIMNLLNMSQGGREWVQDLIMDSFNIIY